MIWNLNLVSNDLSNFSFYPGWRLCQMNCRILLQAGLKEKIKFSDRNVSMCQFGLIVAGWIVQNRFLFLEQIEQKVLFRQIDIDFKI